MAQSKPTLKPADYDQFESVSAAAGRGGLSPDGVGWRIGSRRSAATATCASHRLAAPPRQRDHAWTHLGCRVCVEVEVDGLQHQPVHGRAGPFASAVSTPPVSTPPPFPQAGSASAAPSEIRRVANMADASFRTEGGIAGPIRRSGANQRRPPIAPLFAARRRLDGTRTCAHMRAHATARWFRSDDNQRPRRGRAPR